MNKPAATTDRKNFIRDVIDHDLKSGRHTHVVTRFPPEPNGFLHIGHAKAICVDFGIAQDYDGRCHLRFDDTNPSAEDVRFVDSIQEDVKWLGFDWGEHLYFASDYYQRLYELAQKLITDGKAYVCDLSEQEIRQYRGTLTEAGKASPYRDRSVEENLELFARMKAGAFHNGTRVLRAKIDMAASNMKMRDPLLYRIRHEHHYRTGDAWCIYPMYDFAHCLSDSIEGITHSICTLEFENNRELYDWLIEETGVECKPKQIEFARLNIDYTVMSKRKLAQMVEHKHVSGWDDPRMPTLAGLRRRGYTPEAIRSFCDMIGVAKANSTVDIGKLEYSIRDDLNHRALRVMCVLDPLKVIIENFPEKRVQELTAPYFPADVPKNGARLVPFSRELYIERSDFMENPPEGYHRLAPGREVRLRHGYVIKCESVVKDPETGKIIAVRCTHDPLTLNRAPIGRKVKGVIHWVSASHSVEAEVRLYDRLFTVERPDSGDNFLEYLNPKSLVRLTGCRVEPSVEIDVKSTRYQFERQGYFWRDPVDSLAGKLVFNRIVPLRDSWTAKATATESQPIAEPGKSERSKTRPPKRSRAELREKARAENPELAARYAKYQSEFGLTDEDADVLAADLELCNFFEAAATAHGDVDAVVKWIKGELLRELKEHTVVELPFGAAAFAELVGLVEGGTISGSAGKDVLAGMMAGEGTAAEIVKARGLEQVTDAGAVEPAVDAVISANPKKVDAFRGGKTGLLGFFVGQVMKETGGRADPKVVKDLVAQKLRKD